MTRFMAAIIAAATPPDKAAMRKRIAAGALDASHSIMSRTDKSATLMRQPVAPGCGAVCRNESRPKSRDQILYPARRAVRMRPIPAQVSREPFER